jgi:hypothetical protein
VHSALHALLPQVEQTPHLHFRTLIECYQHAGLRYPEQRHRDAICDEISRNACVTPTALNAFFAATIAANRGLPSAGPPEVLASLVALADQGALSAAALTTLASMHCTAGVVTATDVIDDDALDAVLIASAGFGDAVAKIVNAAWSIACQRPNSLPITGRPILPRIATEDVVQGLQRLRSRRSLPAATVRDRQVSAVRAFPPRLRDALRAVATAMSTGIAKPNPAEVATYAPRTQDQSESDHLMEVLYALTELSRRGVLRAAAGRLDFAHRAVINVVPPFPTPSANSLTHSLDR